MNDEQSENASVESEASVIDTSLPGSALGSDIQAKIGQHLRAMYDDVVRQGVPDRFMDLLTRLDQSAGASNEAMKDERDKGGRR